jgi:hypothetical protein
MRMGVPFWEEDADKKYMILIRYLKSVRPSKKVCQLKMNSIQLYFPE